MNSSVVQNASDPRQVRAGKKKARQIRKQELADLKAVLSTPAGLRVWHRFMGIAGKDAQSYVALRPGSQETLQEPWRTFANDGMRFVGQTMYDEMVRADLSAEKRMYEEVIWKKQREEQDRELQKELAQDAAEAKESQEPE